MRRLLPFLLLIVAACEGPAGPAGTNGTDGKDGPEGPQGLPGDPGSNGSNGTNGTSPWLTYPGVKVTITDLTFASGKATVAFTLTDPKGTGLDRSGLFTDGQVSVGFVLAQLATNPDGSAAQYTAYTTRVQATPDGQHSATQATSESSGTFTVVDLAHGKYTYQFAADLSAYDASKTQTVAATASRTMMDGSRYRASDDHSVGPTTRQVVTLAACNSCHGGLTGHGGSWSSTSQCVLCHQPQSSDPDTGNTVDFKVMVHKIHAGSSLPSVVAGGKYDIVGYMQQDHDFSTVEFPQAVNNCTACHATNAVQASAWKDDPSIATCTSCHDTTVFKQSDVVAGKTVLHTGLEQADGTCDICHRSGSIHPVDARHYVGTLDPTKPQLAVTIDSITNTGPGQAPTVAFTVNYGGAPRNIIASPLTRLRVTFAGPNTDFATFWQGTVQGTGANGTLAAVTDGSDGKFKYTVAAAQAIPAAATGSYTVGMEGYVQDAAGVRWATMNPVQAFAVTDATAQPRREVVALDSCNACHGTLNFHGPAGQGARRDPKYCVLCHNANNTGNGTAKLESSTVLSESVDFKAMIHKIHMGERRTMPWTWVSGVSAANPAGTTTTFDVRYPRDQATCTACHQGKTYQLPIVATALPTLNEELTCTEDPNADTNNYCDAAGAWIVSQQLPLAPEVAVCTSCHDAPYVAIHAATNTVNGQTACTTCHGPGAQLDVDVVHHLQ